MEKANTLKPGFPEKVFIRWLLGLSLVLVLAGVFTALAEDVWFREGFAWDAPIIQAIHQFSNPWLDPLMSLVTQTGEAGAIVIVVIMAAWFIWKNRRMDALSVVASFGGAAALNTLLKLIFARPRPALFPPLVLENDFSFPSGHVTASVAVYGFLAVLLWRSKHRLWALVAGAWVLLVTVSRIYLGVHYPSDTLAALAFASLWLMMVFAVHDRVARRAAAPDASPG